MDREAEAKRPSARSDAGAYLRYASRFSGGARIGISYREGQKAGPSPAGSVPDDHGRKEKSRAAGGEKSKADYPTEDQGSNYMEVAAISQVGPVTDPKAHDQTATTTDADEDAGSGGAHSIVYRREH